jgi:hypothetical protein
MTEITSVEPINIYVDEIKEYKNQLGEQWAYIGILMIPTRHRLRAYRALQADREEVGYDGEIHFTELRNFSYAHIHQEKTLLAKQWLRRTLQDTEKIFHFNLLGINLSNLQHNLFGRTARERRPAIYNRFLRMAVLYPAQRFFSDQLVQIRHLYHDETEMQRHNWFKSHLIQAVNDSPAPVHFFDTYRIQFLNSDHRRETAFPRDSHFVQLCDLLTGVITQVLDNRANKDGCNELASDIYPLMPRLLDPRACCPDDPYRLTERLYLSFFPSRKLTAAQLNDPALRQESTFYRERPLLWTPPQG